jgi:hypothetical protein
MKRLIGLLVMIGALLISSCAATVDLQKIKLESGRVYEVAKTRSGVEFADCGTQLVSYLFDEKGTLLDSKSERGEALHCGIAVSLIRAGGEIGAANQIRRGIAAGADTFTNINEQAQGQFQGQAQGQTTTSTNVNVNTNKASNRTHWEGGSVKPEHGGHGNNGGGNGSGDGTNPGTGHHHDNGDNN